MLEKRGIHAEFKGRGAAEAGPDTVEEITGPRPRRRKAGGVGMSLDAASPWCAWCGEPVVGPLLFARAVAYHEF